MEICKISEKYFDGAKRLLDELNSLSVQSLPNNFRCIPTTDEQIRFLMDDLSSELIIAVEHNEVIGVAEIYQKEAKDIPVLIKKKYIYIQNFIVYKKFRKKGIGHELICAVKQWGKERGISNYNLSVIPSNKSAIDFYDKEGFKSVMISMDLR